MALYIVSTPIGNLEDITLRALRTLFTVPVILAEDTRRSGNLIDFYKKKPALLEEIFAGDRSTQEHEMKPPREGSPKYISLHDQNEARRIETLIPDLKSGVDMALVSDAGTPLLSDPGFKLVRRCLAEHIRVVSVPGPSAWVSALTTSGMPTDRVLFIGYLSPRERRRKKELSQLQEACKGLRKAPTLALYESPHRLLSTLQTIMDVAGNVDVVVATELTKLHEKVSERPVSLWIAEYNQMKKIKGEYTLLFRF